MLHSSKSRKLQDKLLLFTDYTAMVCQVLFLSRLFSVWIFCCLSDCAFNTLIFLTDDSPAKPDDHHAKKAKRLRDDKQGKEWRHKITFVHPSHQSFTSDKNVLSTPHQENLTPIFYKKSLKVFVKIIAGLSCVWYGSWALTPVTSSTVQASGCVSPMYPTRCL